MECSGAARSEVGWLPEGSLGPADTALPANPASSVARGERTGRFAQLSENSLRVIAGDNQRGSCRW